MSKKFTVMFLLYTPPTEEDILANTDIVVCEGANPVDNTFAALKPEITLYAIGAGNDEQEATERAKEMLFHKVVMARANALVNKARNRERALGAAD